MWAHWGLDSPLGAGLKGGRYFGGLPGVLGRGGGCKNGRGRRGPGHHFPERHKRDSGPPGSGCKRNKAPDKPGRSRGTGVHRAWEPGRHSVAPCAPTTMLSTGWTSGRTVEAWPYGSAC